MTVRIIERSCLVKIPVQLMVSMTFGRPGKKCVNFGICHMELVRSENQFFQNIDHCTSCKALARLTAFPNKQIELTIKRTSNNKKYLKKYFGGHYFLIEEDYELPIGILKKIGEENKKIPKGTYKILKELSSYTVILQLE